MNRLALAVVLLSSAALLSGCIIVPHRHGHRGGHHHGHGHGHGHHYGKVYGGGPVYVQPLSRR